MLIRDLQSNRYFNRKLRRRFEKDRMPHELTFSCFQRYQFLNRDRTRIWFIEALGKYRKQWLIDLWAWVIMPEHIHLIVAPRAPRIKVGRFVGKVKEETARKSIRWLEQHSPNWIPKITVVEGEKTRRRFWQAGGGYDRNIEQLETLWKMVDYIHQNPVRRGLVAKAEDWEWSSARWYAGMSPVRLEMDKTIPAM